MATFLSNPTLKIPLLLTNLVCGHICSLSPNPPPKSVEKGHYEVDKKTREIVKDWALGFPPIRRGIMHTFTVIEMVLILVESNPSLFSKTPLSALIPPTTNSHLRITNTFLLGFVLTFSAAFVRILCYRTLGRHFTFQLAILPHHKLITSGPYAIVRHPGYIASICDNIGTVLCQVGSGSWLGEVVVAGTSTVLGVRWGRLVGGVWVFMVTGVSYMLVSRIPKEDRVLKREFGGEWERWAERTPCRLIPGIW